MNSVNKIDKQNVEDILSLTSMQEGMLYHYINNSGNSEYLVQLSLTISGDIIVDFVKKAWEFVVEANEMLRTVYRWQKLNNPLQIVLKKYNIHFKEIDISKELENEKQAALERIREQCRLENIDISTESIKVTLCKLNSNQYEMIVTNHHIIFDGWSNGIILKDFMYAYSCYYHGDKPVLPVKNKFKEYIKWYKSLDKEAQKLFWGEYLHGFENNSSLFQDSNIANKNIKSYSFKVSDDIREKAVEFSKKNKISQAALFYSVWGILLQKYSGEDDTVFGTTVSGRNAKIKGIEDMVGLFINTLPLRVNNQTDDIIDILSKVEKDLIERQEYESAALTDIKSYAYGNRNVELFDSIVVVENYPLDIEQYKNNILHIDSYKSFDLTNYNMTVSITTFEDIEICFYYNQNILSEDSIKSLASHFNNILYSIVNKQVKKVSQIELLNEEEKQKLLYEFNDTYTDYLREKTVQELFEEQVERTPENAAVVFENEKLTYRELNERANRLARTLREKGVKPDNIIGIMVEKSLEMIVGILAVLKAGGAYLPIDPDYPEERVRFMLEDSKTKLLLTQRHLLGRTVFKGELLDLLEDTIYAQNGDNLEKINSPKDLAYVIYTSGSTGRPKGVMLEHIGLTNLAAFFRKRLLINENDRIIQFASSSFDASVSEYFMSLVSGAVLYIPSNQDIFDVMKIDRYISENKITIATLPPAYAALLSVKDKLSLRTLITAGSESNSELIKKWGRVTNYINAYGPTESTVCTSMWNTCEFNGKNILIGKPIDNIRVYVIDKSGNLQPIGVPGELCISGDGLARGYFNNPELTAEKFVDNPFIKDERMYRTGDLARWLTDGNIEFLGRIDHQVKIRGFRIELGEIENSIQTYSGVREAVVVDKEDENGSKYLCAYIVSEDEIVVGDIRQHLLKKLPEYMVPSYFIKLDSIPLTSNGKIDRKALPVPEGSMNLGTKYEAPRNEVEEKLCIVWKEVLRVEKIGINDNFFEVGGHSLKATVLAGRIHKELDVEIPLKEIFSSPTIKGISEYIQKAEKHIYASIERTSEREYYEVSSAQKRMYMLQQFDLNSTAYNMPAVMEVEGKLDFQKFEYAIKALLKRHETLRTYFETIDGSIVQKISKETNFEVEYSEIYEEAQVEAAAAVQSEVNRENKTDEVVKSFVRAFELNKAPLLRVGLIKVKSEKYILMFDMHHIISDGVSMGILISEFVKLYEGKELKELRFQYKDYSEWQNNLLKSEEMRKQQEYWFNKFSGDIPVLNLPTDYLRPSLKSFDGDRISFNLSKELTEKLNKLGRDTGSTLYMLLLSAVNILLSKYSGQEDIVIGSPIAGRSHADLEGIIGVFVNTLAMRNEPKGDKSYEEFLKEVRENALKAYENQDYQFEELVDKLNITRDMGRNPLFDVMFAIQNMDSASIQLQEVAFKQYEDRNKTSKFDISITAIEMEEEILLEIEYCTKLFKKATIERMIKHFENILNVIITDRKIYLKDIELLGQEEKNTLLYEFNSTNAEYPRGKTIYELFEEQVERTPDNIAIVFEESSLTYRELNEKSNRLARTLREKGVGPDSIVGIMVERSLEMIVGIIAILKVGGAYLPIDHDYPEDRIKYMLEDSKTNLLITQKQLLDRISFNGVMIDLHNDISYAEDSGNLEKLNSPKDLAYVIYTSGSTGKPKGVMITHRNVINLVKGLYEKIYKDYTKAINIGLIASYVFDASVQQIFASLLMGHKLFIVSEYTKLDGDRLFEYYCKNNIQISDATPAYIQILANAVSGAIKDIKVDKFIIGGDKLSYRLVNKFLEKFSANKPQITNIYGPTECTVDAVAFNLDSDYESQSDCIPIGTPLSNYSIYILDKNNSLQPIGVPGELCISGDGLGKGYLNNEELTAEKFVDNPFVKGEIMYKTGDMARWLIDGNIEFLERIDHQVKIRGFRIELGEIESNILTFEGIREAVVVDKEDEYGDKYLCAYIVSEVTIEIGDIRQHLLSKLPAYMVPLYFVQLEKMPLTPNGKLDKKALPSQKGSLGLGTEYEAPRNDVEEKLCSVWQEVLGAEKVGISDNFFELGGDSIKAIQVVARIKKYGYMIEVKDLFRNPSIKGLRDYVKISSIQINQDTVEGKIELTPIQKWFFEQNFVEMHHWNQSVMLFKKDRFNENILKKVFEAIMMHHDSLRMIYSINGNDIVQINRGTFENMCDLNIFDYTDTLNYEKNMESEIERIQGSIDLNNKSLMKIGLFKTNEGDHLLIAVHHLVIDGISWRILFEDFAAAYKQLLNNQDIVFERKTTSYKEWAEGLKNYSSSKGILKELDYWRKIENTSIKPLPKDYEVNENILRDVKAAGITFTKEDTENLLKNVNFAYNTEINDILLTALGLTIKDWVEEDRVLVNLEGHGRENILKEVDISRTIGWFTSQYPVILNMEKSEDIAYSIKSVKENLRHIPNKGIGYGIIRYLTDKDLKSGLRYTLIPEICFNYLGQFDQDIPKDIFEVSKLSAGHTIGSNNANQYALNVSGIVADGQLSISIMYNSLQYKEETIHNLCSLYEKNLKRLIEHCVLKDVKEVTPSDLGDNELIIEEYETIRTTIASTDENLNNQEFQSIYVLSPMQEGMLFHSLMNSEIGAYFENAVFTINGHLDINVFEESFNLLVKRYDILRTVFIYENLGKPRQVVLKNRTSKIYDVDISGLNESEKAKYINEFIESDRKKGFDLSKDMLMRISVLRTDKEKYKVVWSHHHILMDGWCLGIIFKDFLNIYSSIKNGKEPGLEKTYNYMNYIKWINTQDKEELKEYWTKYLHDYDFKASIPYKNYKSDESIYLAGELEFKFGERLTVEVGNLAKANQVTTNSVVQAIWGILLQKYNAVDDVVFGTVVSGRSPEVEGIESMVGLFINTIPVRVKSNKNMRFRELLKILNNDLAVSNKYSYNSLAEIQAYSNLKQDLIDNIVVFENYPIAKEMENEAYAGSSGFTVNNVKVHEQTNYNLNLVIIPGKDISLRLSYNKAVYDEDTIEMIAKHFNNIVTCIVNNADIYVEDIVLLGNEDKNKLIYEFNNTYTEYPREKTIHELFEEQVMLTPDGIAVAFEDNKLTYRELNEESNKLARILREKGIGAGGIVGMMVERSLEMIIGIMGVLKAGGAYLPIDPDNPEDRIKYMLEDSKTNMLLTQTHLLDKISFDGEVIDLLSDAAYAEDGNNLKKLDTSEDLAYIIYTSGSTGKPKGTLITNRNVIRVVKNTNYINITDEDRILQLSNYAFDGSVFDIYGALLNGGKLVMINKDIVLEYQKLAEVIEKEKITIVFLTTALFNMLIDTKIECLKNIKKVLFGGEKVSFNHVEKALRFLGKDKIIHVYGPTESTVYATYYNVNSIDESLGTIPIGKPISNTQMYIFDSSYKSLQPIGVVGELCISGDGLAKGYLNNNELTLEKFIDNPVLPGNRMYKTGDIARWLSDGNIEFIGRIDHQVKLRGFRIELDEIRDKLLEYPMIKEAIVLCHEEKADTKFLCAYIVCKDEIDVKDLREKLSKSLPVYMIPSYFVQLNNMPLTPNGKIDRKALPIPEGRMNIGTEYEAPRNDIEEKLSRIWEEILGVEKIGINDNFFELGGHSLKATVLAGRINKEFDTQIPLKEVFSAPTIKGLSEYLQSAEKNLYASIEKAPEKEYYEASSAQKRMYMLQQFDLSSTVYNIPSVMEVEGKLDIERIKYAVKSLIERHETLRTSFETIDGSIVQKISRKTNFEVEYSEIYEEVQVEAAAAQLEVNRENKIDEAVKSFVRVFDLSKAPLLRVGLIKVQPEKYILMFDMHHIISDGVSMGILISELMKLYEGKELKELRLQYKDYSEWQNNLLKSEEMRKQEEYWLSKFSGEVPVLNILTDHPRTSIKNFEGDRISFNLSKELTEKLNKLGRDTGSTLYMLLLSAINIFLSKYSDQDDIIIGSPIAGRSHADLEGIIGMFVNTLTMRNEPKGEKTYEEFLKEVRENALKAYENQDYQFEELVDKLNIARDMGRNPLFDVMFVLENMEMKELNLQETEFKQYKNENKTSKFDFTIAAEEADEGIALSIEYSTKLFEKQTIERMRDHLINILNIIVEDREICLKDIVLLGEEEKNKLLREFNDTYADYPSEKTIHELFEEQAGKTPNNIAVIFEDNMLTYREMNEKSNRLARTLRAKGIGPDSIVGIMAERSLEMIVGIMGILKAGGAYLPIDSNYPRDRIKYMLEDSKTTILLTQRHLLDRISFDGEILDLHEDSIYVENTENLEQINTSKDLAYIIYTSGSTGTPKGVMCEHKNVVRLIKNTNYIEFRNNDRILQTGSMVFDASTFEVWGALLNGLELYLAKNETIVVPELLEKFIVDNKITILWLTSELFNQIAEEKVTLFRELRCLLVGGDVLSPKYINLLRRKCSKLKIINGYGPTENTTFSATFSIEKEYESNIPIGKPIANSKVYILNENNKLLPVGVSGELCVSGDGLSRGYLNRPELTAEKFVDNPFEPGKKMYKTGDLARWLSDGNIEFIGRKDNQVKIRGFRIELGEIENRLLQHEAVREAAVVVKENAERNKYICAYIVSEKEVSELNLREYLKENLPEYMIPAYFSGVAKMPLTTNGKLDRKALPEPSLNVSSIEYEAPRNEIEEKLCKLWEEVLAAEKIGINDNFFELGGHSLKATILVSRIHKELDIEISLKEVFSAPTVKGISEYIKRAWKNTYASIEKVEEREYYEASSAQKRIYMLQQLDLNSTAYNMPAVMEIEGRLNVTRLENAINALIERHESLRTYFENIDGTIVQRVIKKANFQVEYKESENAAVELEVFSEEKADEAINGFVRAFDLGKAPLLRVGLIKVQCEKYILMIDMHHIISDGVSMGILISEFIRLYEGKELKELKLQYKDYSHWQNNLVSSERMKKQEEYWINKFSGEVHVLNMPIDYQRPSIRSFEGDRISFCLDKELTKRLNKLSKETGTTLYMLLLSAVNILLSKYSGQEDIIIGSPIAGRPHADLDGVIGMFVNTLAMRNEPSGDKTFEEFLKEVRENALMAYENQDYQFEEFVSKLNINRDMNRNPLFDVVVTLQNIEIQNMYLEDISFKHHKDINKTAKFDLTITAEEVGEEIALGIDYSVKLFEKETIKRMGEHLANILNLVAADKKINLKDIKLLGQEEKNRLLYKFNDTYSEYPKEKTIYELFEEQAIRTPNNEAAVFENEKLTYRELNLKANRLARTLREKGIGPDSIVGIMVERSLEMMIGIIGILKAGGAYLPIDPAYPEDRIKYMLEDSKTKLLLTQKHLIDKVSFDVEVLDFQNDSIYSENGDNLGKINSSEDLAYIIYTSGSTGRPKGAMIKHHSVVNRLNWMQKAYPINEGDVILQKTPFTFDVSVWELFWWILGGTKVVLLIPGGEKEPKIIAEVIDKEKITVMHFVPSMLNAFLAYLKEYPVLVESVKSLRQVFASGEALTLKQVEEFNKILNKKTGAKLTNLYGPTEATVDVSYFDCSKGETLKVIPIGKPIDNIKLYVVDKYMNLQPIGIPGELCISGEGLARGYLNRPELTSEKFVDNPFGEVKKMYRTGDLARVLPDGNIEYLGRIDNQVKIRGLRIELGEIENSLRKHPYIKDAVVLAKDDKQGEKYLAAYIEVDKIHSEVVEGKTRYTLPNNMAIVNLNKNETDFMYNEIFIEQNYIRQGITIKDRDCIFDVGANIGMFSLFANKLGKDIKMYSFEPIPDLFELLKINTDLYNENTKVFNCGLSNENTETIFTYYPKASIMSGKYGDIDKEKDTFEKTLKSQVEITEDEEEFDRLYSELVEDRFEAKEVVCQLKTLSNIIEENDIEKIDLLKIDVEKSEMDVLQGIRDEHWKMIKQFVLEVHDIDGQLDKVRGLLKKHGFNVFLGKDNELESTDMYNVYALAEWMNSEEKHSVIEEVPSRESVVMKEHLLTKTKIVDYLKESLPEYMVPSYIVQLNKMPLNSNGKIDRKELSKLTDTMKRETEYEAPRNSMEEELAEIWSNILGEKNISINDSFFELGGHSLKATMLASKIHKEFNVEIKLKDIFNAPTIRELSEYIQSSEKNIYSSIEKAPEREYYEASSTQKRMYMLQQFDLGSTVYNIPAVMEVEGKLNLQKVESAVKALIQRNETLRTSFETIDGGIIQRINKEISFEIEYAEGVEEAQTETATAVQFEVCSEVKLDEAVKSFVRAFDLSKAPLLRVGIIKVQSEKYILMFDMHHIISDGVSMGILTREFIRLYEGQELKELKIQYKDYSHWQNNLLKSEEMIKQEKYWLDKFSGEIPVLNMPTDNQRPGVKSFEGDRINFNLSKDLTKKLYKLGKETGSTLYMLLLSVVNILLSKYSGQEDIIVGSPIAGRSHADLEVIIGMFVNTLAMRNEPKGEKTYEEFLKEVKENALKAYENQDYQFEELIDKLDVTRDMSRNPLFDVMLVLQNMESQDIELDEIQFKQYKNENRTSKFDLTITAEEVRDEIVVGIEYCTKLFEKETIKRMAMHFTNILNTIVEDRKVSLKDVELLGEEEKNILLYEFNDTYTEYPREKTIHKIFEEQVQRTPDNVAAVFEGYKLTYRELNERANSLARILRNRGVEAESIVGILAEKSLEMIVGIIGILKAGGAYLPIDPNYPEDRIAYTLSDSGTNILLTQNCLISKVKFSGEIIDLNDIDIYKEDTSNLESINTPENLAYIIYTSGTTGKPKGAMIEHKNVVRLLFNDKMLFDFNHSDVWTMFHSFCFDFSVWEMYGALLYGGKLIVVPKEVAQSPESYLKLLKEEKVTILNQVPSVFYNLIKEEVKTSKKELKLRYIIFGGEALKPIMLKPWEEKYPATRLINMYGITETTVHVTFKEIKKMDIEDNISNIGKPIPTLTTYIMDKNMKLLPVGVPGEICVGGLGVGRGYLNREELTKEKYVQNPYKPEETIYRSGDAARMLPSGDMEYLGRIDQQVKIRGFRIELREIESNILTYEGVKEAVVIDREDEGGNKYLCAYIVSDDEIIVGDIRQHLLKKLPEYMIPSYFVRLPEMPLTANGKVDRKTLPMPQGSMNLGAEYKAPRNEMEESLVSIWKEVLGVDQIGIDDNFFELGGHSLRAIQVIALIEKHLHVKIELADLFNRPTIAGLGALIASGAAKKADVMESLPKQDYYELSYSQKRLWIINELNPLSIAYNMSVQVTLREKVDINIIKKVFEKLIVRHEALRTKFKEITGNPVQVIDEITHLPFEFVDISEMRDESRLVKREKIFKELAQRNFNLQESPLMYVSLVKVDEEEYDLDISMHHIISDGYSLEVLKNEFYILYNEYKQGRESSLAPLKIQYKDFAAWQNKLLENKDRVNQAKEYWAKQLSGDLPVLKLPGANTYSNLNNRNSAAYRIILSEDIKNKLKELANKHNNSLFMVILAAFKVLLSDLTKEKDILIGTAGMGRNHADLNNVIGYFINTTFLRNQIDTEENFEELLQRINDNTLKALEYQYYPVELILDELKIKYPKINVFINMLNMGQSDKTPVEDFEAYHIEKVQDVKFELVWYVTEYANGVEIMCAYLSDLFDSMTIEFIMGKYVKLLENILNNTTKPLKELNSKRKKIIK